MAYCRQSRVGGGLDAGYVAVAAAVVVAAVVAVVSAVVAANGEVVVVAVVVVAAGAALVDVVDAVGADVGAGAVVVAGADVADGGAGQQLQDAEHALQQLMKDVDVQRGHSRVLDCQLASYPASTYSKVDHDSRAVEQVAAAVAHLDLSDECVQVLPGRAPAGSRDFASAKRPTDCTRCRSHRRHSLHCL